MTAATPAPREPRVAALVVLIVAALASIATSPTPPKTATRPVSYTETMELTAATPTAVRRLAVQLNADAAQAGMRASLVARLEGAFQPDAVGLSIIPDQPGNQDPVTMPNRRDTEPGTLFFAYGNADAASCERLPCARTYHAIVELKDRPGGGQQGPVEVTLRVSGGVTLTVTGATEVPTSVRFKVEPVGELERLARPTEVAATSEPVEVDLGGPDRLGSEVHAVVVLGRDTLPPTAIWPVIPEVILHVEAAAAGRPTGSSPQLSVTPIDASGNRAPNAGSTYLDAGELPVAVSRQNVGGCTAGAKCRIQLDVYLGAQSPGRFVPVRWWVETRVRYFQPKAVSAHASASIEVVDPAERRKALLAECAKDPIPVLILAAQRGLITDDELVDAENRVLQGTFDPTTLERLEGYEALCRAAIATTERATASPTPPPSERDPYAPRVEASLPAEPLTLAIDTPLFVRDVRLTRSAVAEAPDLPSVGYLRIDTTAPEMPPDRILDATIHVLQPDGGIRLVQAGHVTSSPVPGWSVPEFDPWSACEAGAACTVDVRVVFVWRGRTPDARFPFTWQLRAGVAWPGAPSRPENAAVTADAVRGFDTAIGAATRSARAQAPRIMLLADGDKETRRVTLRLADGAWPAELTGVPIPGHALLHVSASGAGTGAEPTVWVQVQAPSLLDQGAGDTVELNSGARTLPFGTFGSCEGRTPCEAEFAVTFERADRSGSYGPIAVDWSIEAVLQGFEAIPLPSAPGPGIEVGP